MTTPNIFMGKVKIPDLLLRIDELIYQGMNMGALNVSVQIQLVARKYLSKAIEEYGGTETGKLSEAIITKKAMTGYPTYVRHDVIVDSSRIKYSSWVEVGKYAGKGLPYSVSGTRDYSKSKFTGHRYMEQALQQYKGRESTLIVADKIREALYSKSAFKGLGKE